MHQQRVTVWCGLWAGGIIRAVFFSKMRPVRQYCDDVRDREMITKCLCPESEDMDVHDMWFQENTDG